MRKLTPTYYAKNLYVVDPLFFKEIGIETLLLDLDNTLASYRELTASQATLVYLEKLINAGLKVYLVSNNKGERVKTYAQSAGLSYIAGARKPLTKRIRQFLEKEKVNLGTVMMVGDQLLTDVFCANNLGVKILLTDQLVKEDQWTTRFNRLLDRPIRKRLKAKNKLKEWHDGRRTQEN
ncbi:MAG: YqeG family HAD IIIA-type phosphatase [Bacilli bacterium]